MPSRPPQGRSHPRPGRSPPGRLRADLAARARASDTGPTATPEANRAALTRWRNEPDLACVRDPGELGKLAPDERKEYIALWADVAAVLARTAK